MKKLKVYLSVLFATLVIPAFSVNAVADDGTVSVYGILDVGLTSASSGLGASPNIPGNISPFPQNAKASNRVTGMSSSGLSADRIGIKGTDNIDGRTKTVFVLESGLNLPTGNNPNARLGAATTNGSPTSLTSGDSYSNGQLFDRDAYVGLANTEYGEIDIGRQHSIGVTMLNEYDPMNNGFAVSPLGWYGGYPAGGDTAMSRWDNSIKYTKQLDNLTVITHYSFGGSSNSFATGQSYGVALNYSENNFSVGGAYLASNDANKVVNENGTTIPVGSIGLTFADTKSFLLATKYKFDKVTLKAGAQHIQISAPSNPVYDSTTSTSYGVNVASNNISAYGTPNEQNIYWVGVNYDVTPNLVGSIAYYTLSSNRYQSQAGSVTNSDAARYYSSLLDYSLSKRTDLYAALTFSSLTGAGFSNYTNQTLTTTTVGVRHRF